ncbi:hypothetical protein NDU88_005221 [Pleurodeles waltl]|uniref:ribonuclease H n=1 Tax=Pleurodeles waltl TaxID=8319 RepID=A0AAV7PN16_PLEWA|nr:hypothetical protein NDU88_005221 [Pleurodeles waltl]
MITSDLFKKTWGSRKLFPPDRALVSYEGRRIELEGFIEDVLEFKGRKIWGKVYVAVKGLNILGWFHQGLFGMVLRLGTSEQVMVVKDYSGLNLQTLHMMFPGVFEKKLGCIKGFKHRIKIKKGAIPIKHKLRAIPFSLREDLKLELEKLQSSGVIEPVESSLWLSPIVVTRKRSGEMRLCVDLRSLNKEIWVDSFPLPRINYLLEKLSGAVWFSKIDLALGYHQVVLEEDSRHYTAFNMPFGTFQFCRMPFGLASAASVFQCVMSQLLREVEGVLVFQDDVLIFAKQLTEHDTVLRLVLKVFEENGVVVKEDKCKFWKKEIEFLGHVVSLDGVKPRPGLIDAVRNCPPQRIRTSCALF